MKVLVLGSKGFLGSHFLKYLSDVNTIPLRIEISGSDFRYEPDTPETHYDFSEFDFVLNCVALANIDVCETQPDLAKWINEVFPGKVALHAVKSGCKIVHFSTDAVFDGSLPMVSEEASPNPISVYGRTKWNGEQNVLLYNPDSLILRTNFLGRSPKSNSFFDFVIDRLLEGRIVPGFVDVFFTPIYIKELIRITLEMMLNSEIGIFHLVGNDRISKYQMARIIEDSIGITNHLVSPVSTAHDARFNNRSRDLSLSNLKLRKKGYTLKSIENGISELVKDIR